MRLTGKITKYLNFKGLWHIALLLSNLFRSLQTKIVPLGRDSKIIINLNDPYWSRLIVKEYTYEEEILHILTRARDTNFVFLDCGANINYWSIICSDPAINCKQVLAIEPMPHTYQHLKRNAEINNNRFKTLNRAIYSESGISLHINQTGNNHAGASLRKEGFSVESITIDDILESIDISPGMPIIIKLDVEGTEIKAIQGMQKSLSRDVMIIYEDHGKDQNSSITNHIIHNLGLKVFFITPQGKSINIENSIQATRIKVNCKKGYNFVAISQTSKWHDLII